MRNAICFLNTDTNLYEKDIELTETLGRKFTEHNLGHESMSEVVSKAKALIKKKSIATILDLSGMQDAKNEMNRRSKRRLSIVEGSNILLSGVSCFIFGPNNKFRL